MKFLEAGGLRGQVLWALHALGGEATMGDLLTLTGLPRPDLERSIDSLIAGGQAQVRVLESGDLTYHVSESESGGPARLRRSPLGLSRHSRGAALARARRILLDRKTLRLLRAREGVLSLAELVEQTGLPLHEAEKEMRRMAENWGGEPHRGLDGYVVHAFPEIMSSVHGRFAGREPRPAWVHSDDPMDHARERDRAARVGLGAIAAGASTAVIGPLLLGSVLGVTTILSAGALLLAAGGMLIGFGLRLVLRNHRRFRFSQQDALRRYVLGCVVETALGREGCRVTRSRHAFDPESGRKGESEESDGRGGTPRASGRVRRADHGAGGRSLLRIPEHQTAVSSEPPGASRVTPREHRVRKHGFRQ